MVYIKILNNKGLKRHLTLARCFSPHFSPFLTIKQDTLCYIVKSTTMQQITINVENPSIIPSLRKVLNAIDGISIVPNRRKSGIEEADDDIRNGRVYKAGSVDDMFKQILG